MQADDSDRRIEHLKLGLAKNQPRFLFIHGFILNEHGTEKACLRVKVYRKQMLGVHLCKGVDFTDFSASCFVVSHTDYKTTANIYKHVRDEMLKKAMVNLEEVFGSREKG